MDVSSLLMRFFWYSYVTWGHGRCGRLPFTNAMTRNSLRMAMTGVSCTLQVLPSLCQSMRFLRFFCPSRERSDVLMSFIREKMHSQGSHSDVSSRDEHCKILR